MSQDKDIEQYEKKENAPQEPKIESVLVGMDIPEFDMDNGNVGEYLDELGSLILAMGMKLMERTIKGKKVSADDEYLLKQVQTQHKTMQATYDRMVKSGRIADHKAQQQSAQTNMDFLQKIKKSASTIGSIQRDTREEK